MTTGSSELSNLRRESLLQEHFLFLTLDRVSCVWAGLGSGHGSSGSSARSSVSSQQQPGHWHQGRHGCCGTRPLPDTRRTCRHQANLLYLKSCLWRAVWGRGQHSSLTISLQTSERPERVTSDGGANERCSENNV